MNPEDIAAHLRDIHGLDPVSAWPPGPGWWLVAIGTLLSLMLLAAGWHWLRGLKRMPRGSWRRDATAELHALRRRIDRGDSKQIAAELSELVRRIAMARCGREACAGLIGQPWLGWLTEHDPLGFNWNDKGRLLISLTYAPPGDSKHGLELHELLNAALAWASQGEDCAPTERANDGI